MQQPYNVRAATAATQGAIDQNYNQTFNANKSKALFGALADYASKKRKSEQSFQLSDALTDQTIAYNQMADSPKLTPEERFHYKEMAMKTHMIGLGADPFNSEDTTKSYLGLYDKEPSQLQLANDLKKSELVARIRANATIEASKNRPEKIISYYSDTPGGTTSSVVQPGSGIADVDAAEARIRSQGLLEY